ncbi:latrophilin Cirl-like isoform X2 [Anthonomus grandis grandis]|uniref:latrophilin Cirl-like isoform X2 n=1 Tax=Anthonomus grandis grandis TaxID=2921223 RepID=UPI00216520EA|nr:latrophilin Cirl-like isoform X2 [Anthonomus grandis grandis]
MAWHGKLRPGLLLLLFSFVVISEATAKALEQYKYETAYACEGKTLKIECKDGEAIKLIRANYGRFSITICNDHGNTDWSVNCMSQKSLRVLHARCSFKPNCSIEVNNDVFGDPCEGTEKYIEVHFQCHNATTTTTTSRPSPPWLITSQPPMWSTIKTPSARPPTTRGTITLPAPIPGPMPSSTSVNIPTSTSGGHPEIGPPIETVSKKNSDVWSWAPNNNNNNYDITTLPLTTIMPIGGVNKKTLAADSSTSSYSSSIPSIYTWDKDLDYLPYHCNSTTVRNIFWKSTRVNETAIQPCPPGTTGFAKWHCADVQFSTNPEWIPLNPDLSECRSVWLTSLEQRLLIGKDLLMSIIRDLSTVTGSKTLYGGDMAITTKIIQKMTEKMSQDILTFPDTRQREAIVTEMLGYVTKTSSNLLDAAQYSSWKDLSHKEQMSVATSLLIGLEENAFLLADTVTSQKTVNRREKNILLSVRVLDTKYLTNELFPSDDSNNDWKASNDSIELPKEALLENTDSNLVKLVFVAFDRLEEILQWHPDNTDAANNITRILNSKVISASLGKGRHIQLKEPVRLTLKHIRTENVSNPRCVFWDYTTNAWSEEGCHVDVSESNYTHTVCSCDHLTNFAILMDVHDIYLPIPHEIALQVITYVGCVISIICLILAIVTFQLFRGLKSDRTTIHCNLCTCLLIAEFIFLVGINRTENRIFCGVIAGVLQYFFLCSFVWMFFEGFQLYVMLIEVFEVEKSRIRWYYIFAYGLPFLIVVASATVYHQGYGTVRHCWLKTDNYFIYTFVGPVLIVMLLNVIFLTMAIVMMCRHASASVSMKNKEHSRLASTSGKEENALRMKFDLAWLKGAFVLVFLLGLTWIFGFLYINQESVAMAYLFATFNSFQGFFIFLFHCVQNEKVRKEYRKFIRRHSWLPKCLRCSKSGSGAGSSSTGNTGSCTTSGGVGGKERRPSLYGSNGNPSAGTNSHSTDNSVLTPHGTSLQRGWNSQSCTNVNRACRTPVPTSTSANTAATLSRPPRPTDSVPSPDLEAPNTSTLPYIRNVYKTSSVNPNIPKSVSTWGPLHKPLHWKNISFKSYSRDSGHGGSEQEESPRSHMIITEAHRHSATLAKELQRQAQANQQAAYGDYGMRQVAQQAHCVATGRKKGHPSKPYPWGHHTYTEIYDGQTPRGFVEDDPVYEEIDRNEIQVSDMSDEDAKRQSDMSRQSSRSYGDHRPLIPYSSGAERNFLDVLNNKELENTYRLRCNNVGLPYRAPQSDVRSLAAVLDGETVVCHLEPPEMYPHQHLDVAYVSRTLSHLPSYSES